MTLENNGTSPADDWTVTHTLGTGYSNIGTTMGNVLGQQVIFYSGDAGGGVINASGQRTYMITADVGMGSLIHYAEVIGECVDAGGSATGCNYSDDATVVYASNASFTKSSDSQGTIGETVYFSIIADFQNPDYTGITISDQLPTPVLEYLSHTVSPATWTTNTANPTAGTIEVTWSDITQATTISIDITARIDSIVYKADTDTLYTVDYAQLGILSRDTGHFTATSEPIGSGYGKNRYIAFSSAVGGDPDIHDIDGLSFHPATEILYGAVRMENTSDLLIQIDITTGALIKGAFSGNDYLVIESVVPGLIDVDDITFDPTDETLYGLQDLRGNNAHLIIINQDTGAVTDVGRLSYGGVTLDDMEGLDFGCSGTLWGVTGDKTIPEHNNRLWEIDKTNAVAFNPRVLDHGTDYEAVTCGNFALTLPTPTPLPPMVDSGDYDGDGTSDIAVFRSSSGLWAVRGVTRTYFGVLTDYPVSADYDGDGTADISIFRPGSGLWAIRGVSRVYFGSSSDMPVPGDYDGDGFADIGIFRAAHGLWAIRDTTRVYFGTSGDRAIPGDYDGDGSKDIGIFRPGSGLWAVRGISRVYYGTSGDLPVTR